MRLRLSWPQIADADVDVDADADAAVDIDAEESVKSNSKNLLVKFKSFSNLITDK